MSTISRHMFGRLIFATLAVTAVIAVTQVLDKSHDLYWLVVADVISVGELLTVWGAVLPVVFYHAGPEMVALAVVAQYYLWRQHHEILAQRSVGRSCWQIAGPGVAIGACMCCLTAAMSLYVLPVTFGMAEDIKAAAEVRIAPSMLEEGVQNHITPKLAISFQRWNSADAIEGVVMTDDRTPGEFTLVTAERGYFARVDGTYVLSLENGGSFTHTASGGIQNVSFKQLSLPLVAGRARDHGRGYYEESIGRLLNPPAEMRQDPILRAAWVTEGHHRIANPLRCLGCVLLVLGILVPGRQGNAELVIRLATAMALPFGEDAAATVAFSLAERHQAIALLYLLPAACAAIGSLLLWSGDRCLTFRLSWPKLRLSGPRIAEASPVYGGD